MWEQAGRHYTVSLREPNDRASDETQISEPRSGITPQREIEELATRKSAIAELKEAQSQRDELQRKIEQVRSDIEAAERRDRDQISQARRSIELEVLDLLRRDLERQSTFKNADTLDFDLMETE